MGYALSDFVPFPVDASRVIANLEMAFEQWVDARRALAEMPVSMFWKRVNGVDYLTVKINSTDTGGTQGARSPQTEGRLAAYQADKAEHKRRLSQADALIDERAAQYRALRLPAMPDQQAEYLRELDVEGLLRNDVLVVGTNAFAAYELMCGVKFPAGNEETEDFDLAWCRGASITLGGMPHATAKSEAAGRKSLFAVLRSVDATFKINPKKPYQAINDKGYEVELLAAPSRAPLPKTEAFEPMVSLVEQEWLLKGRAVSFVVSTIRRRACPLVVPDPRWMALHKLWLSKKPERKQSKKPKDRRQGEVLLDACRYFLRDSYPLNLDFVLELPEELREVFNDWATRNAFHPGQAN
jgi:hypothetical protein